MAVQIKLRGVDQELERLDSELKELVNSNLRARVLQVNGELKRVTPVDTGRARNSWLATENPLQFANTLTGGLGVAASLLKPPSRDKIEQFYITNGVDYIDKLNAGSSKQAPARFVENTILKYFDIEGLAYVELGS